MTTHKNGDAVDHPAHYNEHPSGVECIEIVRHMGFNIGNVIKYCWRAGLKSSSAHVEDLRKARFYLDDEIARLDTGSTADYKAARGGAGGTEAAEGIIRRGRGGDDA